MQRIEIAVGDPVDAAVLQEILSSLVDPGILKGFQLSTTSSNTIAILAGAAMTDSGVLIVEDEMLTRQITLTINPANYTIYYSYGPNATFGGNPATLYVQPGLIEAYDPSTGLHFPNGVVLGWLQYPGGSVALNDSMFISGPRVGVLQPVAKNKDEFQTVYSPLSRLWSPISISGPLPDIVIDENYDSGVKAPVTTITNTSTTTQNIVKYLVPFRVPSAGVGQVEVWLRTDSGTSISIYLQSGPGVQITPSNFDIFNNTAMSRQVLQIPASANLEANSEMFVVIQITMNPTYSAGIKSVGISSYTDPF